MVQVQSIQPTPNPNAFKFVCDEPLLNGTRHYPNAGSASGHELAEKLFAIEGVDTLFFSEQFVTVTMSADADWRQVHEKATAALEAAPSGSAPTAETAASVAETSDFDPAALDDGSKALYEQIDALLEDRVRPALAGDGGGLEVVGLEGKTLMIRYQGACGTCPSSIGGTLAAIQNLLQAEVDDELAVVSA
ncbi:MAG: NifU family protein [Planctomycetota bacterium]